MRRIGELGLVGTLVTNQGARLCKGRCRNAVSRRSLSASRTFSFEDLRTSLQLMPAKICEWDGRSPTPGSSTQTSSSCRAWRGALPGAPPLCAQLSDSNSTEAQLANHPICITRFSTAGVTWSWRGKCFGFEVCSHSPDRSYLPS